MSNRTCEITGCVKPHRARGMCSTHYNQQVPRAARHPKVTVPCTVCGLRVSRSASSKYQPTCSVQCRRIVTLGAMHATAGDYDWATDAASRAAKHGARVVEVFDRSEIFARDRWMCQSCGIRCTEPDPFVLTSATVDHVIPYAKRGEHSRANAQTLCLSYNSRKRDAVA